MHSGREAAILVVISFLTVALIFSSATDVLAKPRKPLYSCRPIFDTNKVRCCSDLSYTVLGSVQVITYCTTCTNTSPPSNCSERECVRGCDLVAKVSPPSNTPTPPPKSALPPSTKVCPDNSAPDANGKCPPVTSQQLTTCPDGSAPDANGKCPSTSTNQQVAPSQSLSSNNPQPEHHHKKGQDSTTKKDNGGSSQQAPS
jgi:hypothetical protein